MSDVVSLIRERLSGHGDTIEVSALLNELMERRSYDRYTANGQELKQRDEAYTLDAGEVAYLTGTALQPLRGSAETQDVTGGAHHYPVRVMLNRLGYDVIAQQDFYMPQVIAATPFRIGMGAIPETGPVRWMEVDALVRQSIIALRHELAVLALVGARIAVEEAVRSALADCGMSEEDQPGRPWQREDLLFDEFLVSAQGFAPLDRTSTRAALSAVRNAGNDAAQTGTAPDAHANELFVFQTRRGVASLSAAVEEKVG